MNMVLELQTSKSSTTVGGRLCLDFTNLEFINPDNSSSFTDVVDWDGTMALLSIAQVEQYKLLSKRYPKKAIAAMQRTKGLQDILRRVFSRIAAHLEPAESDLKALLTAQARAVVAAKLAPVGGVYKLQWEVENDLEAILHIVTYDAVCLLSDVSLGRVKACPSCGWLFLDSSKNNSRRWCSMDTCGARDKMRRYYQRSKLDRTEL
jgi:predicted RNA-binding Zn ribbon-like protein